MQALHPPHTSLLPRPSHAFQCMWEKLGRPGQSGDVIRHCLRHGCVSLPTPQCNECGHRFGHVLNCVGKWVGIHNHIQSHHQIDQAFPIFLGTRSYTHTHTHTQTHTLQCLTQVIPSETRFLFMVEKYNYGFCGHIFTSLLNPCSQWTAVT